MNGDPFEEAERNQGRAADPGASVFVTANAGSGKTKVLVDRIARLLLRGGNPSSFLCITFTKAAAAEMQRRLFERLGSWCVADDAKLAADLNELDAGGASLSDARALFARALETPGGLRIQTIHAFCERLLARFPIEAGALPGFDIADETRATQLLRTARSHAAFENGQPAPAFRKFAARLHAEALEGFLDRLALRRADFHRFALAHPDAAAAADLIRARHGVSDTASACRSGFLSRQNWRRLGDAVEVLAGSSANDRKTGERLRAALDARNRGEGEAQVWQACFDAACTKDGEPRKQLVTQPLARSAPWVERLITEFVEHYVEALGALNAIERAEDAIAAYALAVRLDHAYEAAKNRAGVLDFDDLIERAQALLRKSAAAPWVLYKLDGGFDHILIDEGQDTSPAQWDLVEPLQQEFFAGLGAREQIRTVFAVGDPKQSIYGFQGADPERFLAEAQRLESRARASGAAFTGPTLETSFRSSPEVLRVVDETFAPPEKALSAQHDVVRHLAARGAEGGCVEVWPFSPKPEVEPSEPWDAPRDRDKSVSASAQLAAALAEHVSTLIRTRAGVWDKHTRTLRPIRPGDVLVLVRKRGQLFGDIIRGFKRAGLPVAGADRMVLRDELVVQDCLALMRVALDPADDLALACVLKGPWCGLVSDDEDIFPLAHGRGGQTLFSRLMDDASPKYAAARAFVGDVVARRGAHPFAFLSWALEGTHRDGLSGWKLVFSRLGPECRDPLEELLQRAVKPPRPAAPSLQRFLSDIDLDEGEVRRELEAESEAIRVMTVHGAKGLEAPLVILPDTTSPPSEKPDDGLMFDADGAPAVAFGKKDDDEVVSELREEHARRVREEHWRLLYVAMTRARDRLIVCGAQYNKGEHGDGWRLAVENAMTRLGAEDIETRFGKGKRIGVSHTADAQAAVEEKAIALPQWSSRPAPGAAAMALAAPSRLARVDPALFSPMRDGQRRFRRGRLIHQLLERLPDVAADRRAAAARAWLERQGVQTEEAAKLAQEAMSVIDDPRFAAAFGPLSRAEAPVVGEAAGRAVRGVVDRLAVGKNEVTVIDFKTDRPAPRDPADAPESYVLQLALYREVLRKIFPGKRISCALLWTEAPHLMALPESRLDAAFAAFAAVESA